MLQRCSIISWGRLMLCRPTMAVTCQCDQLLSTQTFHVQSQTFLFFEIVLLTFQISLSYFYGSVLFIFWSDLPIFLSQSSPLFQVSPSDLCIFWGVSPFFWISFCHFFQLVLPIFSSYTLPFYLTNFYLISSNYAGFTYTESLECDICIMNTKWT